ncbi:pyochelin synthetase [Pseudomonas aeruginosa]|nr:pyochelin synthetase [Pseudomonas aeruginosa]
MPEEASR